MQFTFAYTAIRARDLERSLAFYTDVLGLKLLGRSKIAETKGELAAVGNDEKGHPIEINWYPDDSPVAGPYRGGDELDHLAFAVEDLDEALAYLAERGHPRVLGPIESENSIWAYVQDPDGIYVELFQSRGRE